MNFILKFLGGHMGLERTWLTYIVGWWSIFILLGVLTFMVTEPIRLLLDQVLFGYIMKGWMLFVGIAVVMAAWRPEKLGIESFLAISSVILWPIFVIVGSSFAHIY